ncbi:hypothetical protein [Wolbachia endosymbiont of Cantharis cryptica]|uniref:hypothetical protein n=1 Tax=Wolbachia endosymbiont of Cantharis cryptica TaxID=3066132 RepID=UPI00376F11FE
MTEVGDNIIMVCCLGNKDEDHIHPPILLEAGVTKLCPLCKGKMEKFKPEELEFERLELEGLESEGLNHGELKPGESKPEEFEEEFESVKECIVTAAGKGKKEEGKTRR